MRCRWGYLEEEDGIKIVDLCALAYNEEEHGAYDNPYERAAGTTDRKMPAAAGSTARTEAERRGWLVRR